MILSQEQRVALGRVTLEELLGDDLAGKTLTETTRKRWEEVSEQAGWLLAAENLSRTFGREAEQLLRGKQMESASSPIFKGLLNNLREMEAYGEAHPVEHGDLPDPLREFRRSVHTLFALAKTTEEDFRTNPKEAKTNALVALGWGNVVNAEEVFDRQIGPEWERTRKEFLLKLVTRFPVYKAVARMRIDALFETLISETKAEARVLEEKATATNNSAEKNELQAEAYSKYADAEFLEQVRLAAYQGANEGAKEGVTQTVEPMFQDVKNDQAGLSRKMDTILDYTKKGAHPKRKSEDIVEFCKIVDDLVVLRDGKGKHLNDAIPAAWRAVPGLPQNISYTRKYADYGIWQKLKRRLGRAPTAEEYEEERPPRGRPRKKK